MAGTNGGITAILTRGRTTYELSNHLGNVLVTVSDRKLQVQNGTTGLVGYYTADVVMATDYYPFGLDMPGRKYGAEGRYGFNGKERDKDMHSLTAYDYGFRIYNPAIGKFLSVDPLTKKYPWYTPYQFAGNIPIKYIDIDGLEPGEPNKFGTYSDAPNPKNTPTCLVKPLTEEEVEEEMGTMKYPIRFLKGAFMTTVKTIGAVTELPAQAHYGDKIKPENEEHVFPLTGDGNIKRLFAETVTSPAYLIKAIINNPKDAEKWGELFGALFLMRKAGGIKGVRATVAQRVTLANKFYSTSGLHPQVIISHLEGINFGQAVQTIKLTKGTVVQQWVGENGVGNYFTPLENGAARNLGITYEGRTLKSFTLTSNVEVLKSTAADYKGNAGGGTQYFSSELKYNIVEKK